MRFKGYRFVCFLLICVMIAMLASCKNDFEKTEANDTEDNSETNLFDEDGIVNYESIEYREDIEYLNKYIKALEGTVVEAHWKYYQWGINFGPTNYIISGFIKVTDEEVQKIESQFSFMDEDQVREEYWYDETKIKLLDYPKGILPEVTGCSDFNWSYSAEFEKWLEGGRWIGSVFYDVDNKIIYFYLGIK